jgi:hypothetical protein
MPIKLKTQSTQKYFFLQTLGSAGAKFHMKQRNFAIWRFLIGVLGDLPRFGLLKKQRHQRDSNLHNWMVHKRKFEIPKEPIFV